MAGAGDLDRDGLPDVIIGAYASDYRGREGSGSTYIIYGKRSSRMVDLGDLGRRGYRLDGARVGESSGYFVAGPGDMDGDGVPDIAVGTLENVVYVHFTKD